MKVQRIRVLCQDNRAFELVFFSVSCDHRIFVGPTGGKLFHGRPPAVVTMRERDAMRCGITVANSVDLTTILNKECWSCAVRTANLAQSYHLARDR